MSMKRYVKQSRGYWIAALVLILFTAACSIPAILARKQLPDMTPQDIFAGDVYLGSYYTVDVQYMTSWIYRINYDDGSSDVFYLAGDRDNYGFVLSMSEEQLQKYQQIVSYTASDDCDLLTPQDSPADSGDDDPSSDGGTTAAPLAAALPLTTAKPAAVPFAGIACTLPEEAMQVLAEYMDMSEADFTACYGDYYLDGKLTPADLQTDWLYALLVPIVYVLILVACAVVYDVQFGKQRKRLESTRLWDRAVSEFDHMDTDYRSAVTVSTAFLYARRRNIVLPLADVAWVYQQQRKLLWARRIALIMLTHDARCYQVVLDKHASRRYADAVISAISNRNPDVLVGLTRENKDIYRQEVPHAKMVVVRPWLALLLGWAIYFLTQLVLRLLLT